MTFDTEISPDTQPNWPDRWLRDFKARNGRQLRVLHIGNIANNAYINAKIQRARGVDAYVAALDYYHIMGTPEWEDAEIAGDIQSQDFPNWAAVDLGDFRRPRWFVSGPIDLSLRYLIAQISHSPLAALYWRLLGFERNLISSRTGIGAKIARKIIGEAMPRMPVGDLWRARIKRWMRVGERKAGIDNVPERTRPVIQQLENDGISLPRGFASFLDNRMEVWSSIYLHRVLQMFDVVQCYATYTAVPYFVGFYPYIAYEHGTLREIPFRGDAEGILCTASYRAAAKVCITNTDNVPAAHRLGISEEKIVKLPHAFDDQKLARFVEANRHSGPAKTSPPVFFAPARQDWLLRDPGRSKSNDLIFKAAKILKEEGRAFSVIAVAWGSDLQASKDLCAELGIADRISWIQVMSKKKLWQQYLQSHAILDQFCCRAFGSVSFETMGLGKRLITSLDMQQCADFFGEAPPVLEASTDREIADRMRRVLDDPEDIQGDGLRAYTWMQKYHSANRIFALQVSAYRDILAA